LFDDMLNQRFAGDERERFAGKPRGGEARGNDAENFHPPNLAAAGHG